MKNLLLFFNPILKGTIKAYPQIFFSNSLFLGILLILVSFFDYNAGLAGLIVAFITNLTAMLFGLNPSKISSGNYGFNAVLTGLGLGVMYQPDISLYVVLIFAGILCLALIVMFDGITLKYGLPFLSIPFLLSMWILTLAIRGFDEINLSERSVYYLNYLYSIWGNELVDFYLQTQNLAIPKSVSIYFSSLGAIFFQPAVVAGVIIAFAILCASRISFLFSIVGFYSGWIFLQIIGGDAESLSYSYVGFNFILTAIAIGSFFVIPSWGSLILVIIISPVNVIITKAMMQVLGVWQLPVYSLPFNFVVLTFLYILKYRVRFHSAIPEVSVQEFSPEKNLYSYRNYFKRFGRTSQTYFLRLPFWGEWNVEQGHNGNLTHTGDYSYAWDFSIRDTEDKTYRLPGKSVDDFYCYKKNVLSPGYGKVVKIVDGIKDNVIGDVNMVDNWGNTIIIKHSEFLYSKLSHLLNGSFKVNEGDFVFPGQIIALVGNSGRSPEPHLHLQFQETPWIGSPTIKYPISHFICREKNSFSINNYSYPELNKRIFNPEANRLLYKTLDLIPGQKLVFEYNAGKKTYTEMWTIYTNSLNKSYIYSETNGAIAWFSFDKTMFYFHHFQGKRDSLLYYFFLAFYKIQSSFYKDSIIEDEINLNYAYKHYQLILNDLFAPFFSLLSAKYQLKYINCDDENNPSHINIESESTYCIFNKKIKSKKFTVNINNGLISEFSAEINGKIFKAKQLS